MSNRTSPLLTSLRGDGLWTALLDEAAVDRRRRRRLNVYRELVASGTMQGLVDDFGRGGWSPSPPVRHHLNKADGRKKVVFTFGAADELMFKALNRALQPLVEPVLSPLCHSFRPGRGPRSAYAQLFRVAGLDGLACLHLDVRDYFNSIPVEQLIRSLPDVIGRDCALMSLLSDTLRDHRVVAGGVVVEDPHKGVMAGTPLAPTLSNLYLGPLDAAFAGSGVTYVRYADDILVLGEPSELEKAREAIERQLAELGLELNPRKTRYAPPGEPWDFLGFRYAGGRLDVAPNPAARLRRRVRRLARRAGGHPDAVGYAVRRLNRRLYGVGGRRQDFSWAAWFFPLLSSTATLRALDQVVQAQLRFAATGRHERRNRRVAPYAALVGAGYVPLVAAFQAFRDGPGAFNRLIGTRTAG